MLTTSVLDRDADQTEIAISLEIVAGKTELIGDIARLDEEIRRRGRGEASPYLARHEARALSGTLAGGSVTLSRARTGHTIADRKPLSWTAATSFNMRPRYDTIEK